MKANMLRTSLAITLVTSLVLVISISIAHAQGPGFGQIFGALNTGGLSGGSFAYLTTPDKLVFPGSWSIALTSTGSYPTYPFIEAGAIQNCGAVCLYNPYYSYTTVNFSYDFHEFTEYNLVPQGQYIYQTQYKGSNAWEAKWCYANYTCVSLKNINLGISSGMPFESSGGESTNIGVPIGTATAWNQWMDINTGAWSFYCYDTPQITVPGLLTNCGSNHDWTADWLPGIRLPFLAK